MKATKIPDQFYKRFFEKFGDEIIKAFKPSFLKALEIIVKDQDSQAFLATELNINDDAGIEIEPEQERPPDWWSNPNTFYCDMRADEAPAVLQAGEYVISRKSINEKIITSNVLNISIDGNAAQIIRTENGLFLKREMQCSKSE